MMNDIDTELTVREQYLARFLKGKNCTFDEIRSVIGVCSSAETARILRNLEKRKMINYSWKMSNLEDRKIRLEKIYTLQNKPSYYKKWISILLLSRIKELRTNNANANSRQVVCL